MLKTFSRVVLHSTTNFIIKNKKICKALSFLHGPKNKSNITVAHIDVKKRKRFKIHFAVFESWYACKCYSCLCLHCFTALIDLNIVFCRY